MAGADHSAGIRDDLTVRGHPQGDLIPVAEHAESEPDAGDLGHPEDGVSHGACPL